MQIDGKWWLIHEGEAFDTETSGWLLLEAGIAAWHDGRRGSYSVTERELSIRLPAAAGRRAERWKLRPASVLRGHAFEVPAITAATTSLISGDRETSAWKDGDWAEEMTRNNRERAGRYSSIDVSMYDTQTVAASGLPRASSVAEIEAALAHLPLAKVTYEARSLKRQAGMD